MTFTEYKTVKNKFCKIILTILTLIVASSFLGACRDQAQAKKYDHLVTFNYNVGELGEGFENQYLGVKDGSIVAIRPGQLPDYKEASLKDHYIEGWYTAKLDDKGEPIVGTDGRVVLDQKWDFDKNTVSGNMTLYANFVQQALLVIKGGDKDIEYSGNPGSKKDKPTPVLAPKKAGYTFLGYYVDENFTEEFAWPYTFEAGVTMEVYARFMEGEWALVSTAKEFITALAAKKNIFVMEDLNFTDQTWVKGITYGGEIAGNGHKLTGITLDIEASKSFKQNFGLFGTLSTTANLHDFTIEDAQITFTDGGFKSVEYKVAMFAWKMEDGVKVTNVTVTGEIVKGQVDEDSAIDFYKSCAIDEGATITNCNFEGITLPELI